MNELRAKSRSAVWAILFLALSGPAIADPAVLETTLCAVAEHPLQFANKKIRLVGTVESGVETTTLGGSDCPNAPHFRLALEPAGSLDTFTFARGWSTSKFIVALEAGELRGKGPDVQWETPVPLTPLPDREAELLRNGARVSVVGRLDFAGDGRLIRTNDGQYGIERRYGHLGCCEAQIVVESATLAGE